MAEGKQIKTTFTGLTLKSFSRNDKGITANFSSNLAAKLIELMGWATLADHTIPASKGTLIVMHAPPVPKQTSLAESEDGQESFAN